MADLFHRVSIRKYQDRPVEREKIVEILRAAMAAPSAKNQQPWEFYVITKKDTLEKLSKASPYAGMTANAPVAIISAYRKDCDVPCYADIDMSIAMENLWLKTDEIGLGGVWLEKNGADFNDSDLVDSTVTGCRIYCEPENAKSDVEDYIKNRM